MLRDKSLLADDSTLFGNAGLNSVLDVDPAAEGALKTPDIVQVSSNA